MDKKVREIAKHNGLLIDLDSEYTNSFKQFLSSGPEDSTDTEGWQRIPLPIQRRLARKGYFLHYFISHPVMVIAMECLPHLLKREDIAEFLKIASMNSVLLKEISKHKRIFDVEACRYALVAHPKVSANVVVQYIHNLKTPLIKQIARSRDCSQMARTLANKLISKRSGK